MPATVTEVGVAASVVVGLLLLVVGVLYNRLVTLRNRTQSAWSDIDVHLTRRHELIPNLVAAVRAYAEHERATLDAVVAARDAAVRAEGTGPVRQSAAETELERAMSQLAIVAEAYPDLKADARFRELATELAATENKVAFSRQLYNDTVTAYQTATQSFPGVLLAGPLGFAAPPLFEAREAQRSVVDVALEGDEGSRG